MHMSLTQWTVAWAATAIIAPVVFGVLLAAVVIVNATFIDPRPLGGFGPELQFIVLFIALAGFLPMMAFGIPTAIMLERSEFTSFPAYAAGGAFSGFVAGAAMVFVCTAETRKPNDELEVALWTAAYGLVAALTFRAVSGARNLTPPGDAGYQPPS
jgi:hypothetical protein